MIKISFRLLFAIAIIANIFYACKQNLFEKQEDIYSKLEGYVYNEYDQPLSDATIKVDSDSTISNSQGYYFFDHLIIGKHLVTVSKDKYVGDSKTIEIIEDSISKINFTLLKGAGYITISDSIKDVSWNNGYFSISVFSNTKWYVENKSGWIFTTDTLREGNSYFTIEYSENTADETRMDTVKIISGTIVKKLIVTQNYKLRIVETKGIIANEELEIVDSFLVRFNKPIQSIKIKSNETLCSSDITVNQSGDKKDIAFNYACGKLGGSYSFNIDATDFDGIKLAVNITIPLYAFKHQFEGYITDFYLLNRSNEMYISTINADGGTIYHYSIEADSILNSFDLTGIVGPFKFSLNTYDNKIYIIGSSPGYSVNTGTLDTKTFTSTVPKIYKLNTNTGIVEDSIEIFADKLDHHEYPCNIPFDIGFTKSGLGIVILKSNETTALRWKFLDTSRNDSIYYYTGEIFWDNYDFYRVYENYNYSKLFLLNPHGSCIYGIYDSNNKTMSTVLPSSITRSYDLIPNRKKELIFVRQLYDQFIMNLQGEFGKISYLDSRHHGSADFDYTDETFQTIFCYESESFFGFPNKFRVLDYSTGSTVLQCDALYDLLNFTTTIDGKWAIAYSLNYPDQSSLYLFNTKMLKREN